MRKLRDSDLVLLGIALEQEVGRVLTQIKSKSMEGAKNTLDLAE